jgi:thymidylate synthase
MYIQEETLDDLLYGVLSRLLKARAKVPGTRGAIREMTGVFLELANPRARLSRAEKKTHLFSGLGEFLWYLAGSNDLEFIAYYLPKYRDESDDQKTVYGAYGPRLLNMRGQQDQIKNVIDILKTKSTSKRAVIQIFDAADLANPHKEIPCTCALQFLVRDDSLCAFTYMRSNDAFWGLPHDIFSFTMLQELIARSLDVEIGPYKHAATSLHLYEKHIDDAKQYVDEGVQARIGVAMPPMPQGEPWSAVRLLVDVEPRIRSGEIVDARTLGLDPYWQDLVRLLNAFRHYRDDDEAKIAQVAQTMHSSVYRTYIAQKQKAANTRKRKAHKKDDTGSV